MAADLSRVSEEHFSEGSEQQQEITWPDQAFTQIEQNVKTPFLPPIKNNRKYTLVLDLDETLIHYDEEH